MERRPPYFTNQFFNTSAFQSSNYLTLEDAQRLFIPITYTPTFAALVGVTPGVAAASKAVVLDASRNIATIGNITSDGVLTLSNTTDSSSSTTGSVIISGGVGIAKKLFIGDNVSIASGKTLTMGSTVIDETDIAKIDGITNGTAAANKALVVNSDLDIANIRKIDTTGQISGVGIYSTAFNYVALNAPETMTAASLCIDYSFLVRSNVTTTDQGNGISFSLTSFSAQSTTPSAYIKANRGASAYIGDLVFGTKETSNATADCIERMRIKSDGSITMSGDTDSSSTTTGALIVSGGVGIAKKVFIGDNVSIASSKTLTIGSTIIDETDIAKIDSITNGTAAASKALIVSSDKDISAIRNLSMTGNLAVGSVSTALFKLHMSPTANDHLLALYCSAIDSDFYGFGANSSNLLSMSRTSHSWYLGSLGNSTGTKYMDLTSSRLNVTGAIETSDYIKTIFKNDTTNLVTYQSWINDLTTDIDTRLSMSNIGASFGCNSAHPLQLMTTGTAHFHISSGGYITIGQASVTPQTSFDLEVQGLLNVSRSNSTSTPSVFYEAVNSYTGGPIYCVQMSSTIAQVGTANAKDFNLICNNNPQLYINASSGRMSLAGTSNAVSQNTYDVQVQGTLDVTSPITVHGTSNDGLSIINSSSAGLSNIKLTSDSKSWEYGLRGSTASDPNALYWYNGTFKMFLSDSGLLSLGGTQGSMSLNVLTHNASAIRIGDGSLANPQTTNNAFTIQYNKVGDGDSGNNLSIDPYGTSNALVCYAWGGVGLGGANGGDSSVEIPNYVSYNYSTGKIYNVQTNTWSEVSSSSINLSLMCGYNVWINDSIIHSSDRRIKRDIVDFDIDTEAYMTIRPRSFTRNDNNSKQIGLIAQEFIHCEPRLVDIVPNKEMVKQESDDPEDGEMLTINYEKIPILNISMIKKLIARCDSYDRDIDELRATINKLKKNK